MRLLFLLLVLSVTVIPQHLVRPARVTIATPHQDPLNRELVERVRSELRLQKRYDRPDYDVGIAAAPLSTDITKWSGLTSALVVVNMDRPNQRKVSIYIGADVESLARLLAQKITEQFERGD